MSPGGIVHELRWRTAAIARLYATASWDERAQLSAYAARELAVALGREPRPVWVRLGGVWFSLMPGRYEIAGYLEIWLRRIYEQVAGFAPAPGRVIVDVGANVGFFAARHARSGSRVIAVEPNPGAASRLRAMVARAAFDVRVEQCAAGAERGAATLAVGRSTLTGTLSDTAARERHDVTVRPLDEMVTGNDRIDLLKIDTEGAEVAVLRGGRSTLLRTDRAVLEHHSPALLDESTALLAAAGLERRLVGPAVAYYERPSTAS